MEFKYFSDPLLDGLEEYHAITPVRLLEQAKLDGFTGTSMSMSNSKEQNAKLVEAAEHLVGFWDDEFTKVGRSIGTKVEFLNNLKKFSMWFYFNGKNWEKKSPEIKDKNLPTWLEYRQGFEVKQ